MSTVVTVDLGARSYSIQIGEGLLAKVGELTHQVSKGTHGLLVSDATVAPLYAGKAAEALARAGLPVGQVIVPAGEASKDGRCLFQVYEKAIEQRLDRQSFVLALGGGVVGDLAGFAAATFLRGVDFIQVPTTLLAMVDSAVGGKTGINLPQGKNLVGSFHQPRLVLCDLATLKTLPPRELASGLAEVVKYGVIRDASLFELLEKRRNDVLAKDLGVIGQIVAQSCRIKADVVGKDEREESGLRATLNFGHTIGHALEAVTGYGKYLHGEAIAVGMVYAARLSVAERGLPQKDCDRLIELLRGLGLPTEAPDVEWTSLRKAMGVDKKTSAGKPRFVLAERLGKVVTGCEVSEDALQRVWQQNTAGRVR